VDPVERPESVEPQLEHNLFAAHCRWSGRV